MDQLLSMKRRPTAIITFNDYVALDAIQFAKRKKIKINEELSIVSFVNLPLCHYMENPPIASVEQFPYEQGKKAAELLWKLLDQSNETEESTQMLQVIIESKLIMHDT